LLSEWFGYDSKPIMRGIAILPVEVVSDEPADKRLQCILSQWQGLRTPIFCDHRDAVAACKTQRSKEFLRAGLR